MRSPLHPCLSLSLALRFFIDLSMDIRDIPLAQVALEGNISYSTVSFHFDTLISLSALRERDTI